MSGFVKAKGFEVGVNKYVRGISGGVVSKSEVLELGRVFQRAHRDFRSHAFQERKILENCFALLGRLEQKQVRWDFVFEVSMKQSDRLAQIRSKLPSATRNLETFLQSGSFVIPQKLSEAINSTGMRTGHLCRWLCDELSRKEFGFGDDICESYQQYVRAKKELAKTCFMLVVKIAHQFRDSGSSLMELVQDGNVGVMIAAEKYDPELGWTFSAYASHWIKRSIFLGIGRRDLIRVPDSKSSRVKRCRLEFAKLTQELRRNFSVEEQMELLLEHKVTESLFLTCCSHAVSLDYCGRNETGSPFLVVAENGCVCPVEQMHHKEVTVAVANALEHLDAREREILQLRFGFNGENEHSLPEIANRTGLTHQRIHQIILKLKSILRIRLDAFQ